MTFIGSRKRKNKKNIRHTKNDDDEDENTKREPFFNKTDEEKPRKVNRKKKPRKDKTPVDDTENKVEGLQKEVEDVETVLTTDTKNPDIVNLDKQEGLAEEVDEVADEKGDTISLDETDKDVKGKAEKKKHKPPKTDFHPRTDDVFGFF